MIKLTEKTDDGILKPTTIRLTRELLKQLDRIRVHTGVTRSALIQLSITAFIDYVERTGKMPVRISKKEEGYASA